MKRLALLLLLVLAAPLGAQPPRLVIPPEVRPSGQYLTIVPETDAVSIVYVGLSGIEPIPTQFLSDKRAFLLDSYGKPAGRYRFTAVAASKTGEQARADFVAVLGDAPPVPPGPTPPVPPVPPSPGGLRVLIVCETADPIPASQHSILYGQEVRDYLTAKCLKVDGAAEWRIWDQNDNVTNETKEWQALFAMPRKELPWIVIASPQGGYEGPLPKTVAETVALLKKFGG